MARYAIGLAVLLLATSCCSLAQTYDLAAGVLPFSTAAGGPYDRVDLATSDILVQIPVRNKVGKIPFVFGLVGNSHAYFEDTSGNGSYYAWFTSNYGPSNEYGFWLQGVPLSAPVLSLWPAWSFSTSFITCGSDQNDEEFNHFIITDILGTTHPLASQVKIDHDGCDGSQATGITTDGSGYTLSVTLSGGLPSATVYDRSGNQLSASLLVFSDPDGSEVSYAISGQNHQVVITYTDT